MRTRYRLYKTIIKKKHSFIRFSTLFFHSTDFSSAEIIPIIIPDDDSQSAGGNEHLPAMGGGNSREPPAVSQAATAMAALAAVLLAGSFVVAACRCWRRRRKTMIELGADGTTPGTFMLIICGVKGDIKGGRI